MIIKVFKILFGWIRRKIQRCVLTSEQRQYLDMMVRLSSMPAINRYEVESKMENMRKSGIANVPRMPRLIVSLTSYPKRMYDIHLCLYSLLTQNLKPDKLILWLAKSQFPEGEDDVPIKVRNLCQFGLEIRWCEDVKSYKKIIPALLEFPNDVIVTADDDIYYPDNWLEKLYSEYQSNGKGIYAHRCHRIKTEGRRILSYERWEKCISLASTQYQNFFTSGGGVLYAPHALHPEVTNMSRARALCPNADDVWLWGMSLLAGTKITLVSSPINQITYINREREVGLNSDGTLFSSNGSGGGNDIQLSKLLKKYPAIEITLFEELIARKTHNFNE